MQVRRRPERLPGRVEHRERLVSAQLDERPTDGLDRLSSELREACREACSRLVAALVVNLVYPRTSAMRNVLIPASTAAIPEIVRFQAS